jgi:hypothetical protein
MLLTYQGPRPFSCRPRFTGGVELADGVVLGKHQGDEIRDIGIVTVTEAGVILRMSRKNVGH